MDNKIDDHLCFSLIEGELVREKTSNLGSDQVRHKLGCTVTEAGWRLEILGLESRGFPCALPLFSPMQIVGFPMRLR